MYYMGEGKALMQAGEINRGKLVHAREHVQIDKKNKWKKKKITKLVYCTFL